MDENGKTVARKETEDLRATHLAFILGIRGDSKPPRPLLVGNEQPPGVPGYNVAYQPSIMPAMVGTERFQQLCSMEYLHEYFKQVLGGKTIELDMTYADCNGGNAGLAQDLGAHQRLLCRRPRGEERLHSEGDPGRPKINPDDTLMSDPRPRQADGPRGLGCAGRPSRTTRASLRATSGPSSRARAPRPSCSTARVNNLPQVYNPRRPTWTSTARSPSACRATLATTWPSRSSTPSCSRRASPTGGRTASCSPRASTTRATKLSNEYLEARDGQLYNIRIQGPAIGTAWTGERSHGGAAARQGVRRHRGRCRGSTPSPPPSTTRRSSPTRWAGAAASATT